MTYFLGQMVVVVVLSVVVALVRSRRARRRREDLRTGGEATCRARLGSGTDRPHAGRLRLSPRCAVWEARWSSARVDLAGAQVLASAAAGGSSAQAAEDVV